MFRGSTLLLALLISSPVLWQALTDSSISATAAVVRFLIAIPVAGVLLGLVRTAASHREAPRRNVRR
jgi:hypothetical protein